MVNGHRTSDWSKAATLKIYGVFSPTLIRGEERKTCLDLSTAKLKQSKRNPKNRYRLLKSKGA
jgi:hypothetical protein